MVYKLATLKYAITDAVIKKYQRVQNIAARLILNIGRRDSSIEARKKLHWLAMQSRIEYKIALLVFKCLMGNAPIYLHNLLCINTGLESIPELRNSENKLIVPYIKIKHLLHILLVYMDQGSGIVYH